MMRAVCNPVRLRSLSVAPTLPQLNTRASFTTRRGFPERENTISFSRTNSNTTTSNTSYNEPRNSTTFPRRQITTKRIAKKEYEAVAKDFESFGQFVNFCTDEEIKTDAKERRAMRAKFDQN